MLNIYIKNTCKKYNLLDDWTINNINQSFELSILDIIEDKIVIQHSNKHEYVKNLKNKMIDCLLDGLYNKYNYVRKRDYNKTKMCIDIASDTKIKKDSTIKYYSDFFNINIIIFDFDNKNIFLTYATIIYKNNKKIYNIDIYKPFVFLIKYKNKYNPLTRDNKDNIYFYSENNIGINKLIDKFAIKKNKSFTKITILL